MATWTVQLDRLEGQIERQRRAASSGLVPELLDLETPAGPMTDTERVRATYLMARSDELLFELLERSRDLRPGRSSPYR